MSIPMVEVFLPRSHSKKWEAVAEPINWSNKLEWFDDLNNWENIQAPVTINGKTKKCKVFLSSDQRGWVGWEEFSAD